MKKKWIFFLIFIVIGGTCYYDLKNGTLSMMVTPAPKNTSIPVSTPAKPKDYEVKVVQPGDTVLSIEEHLNPNKSISIIQVLSDFKSLNPSVDPNHIQIGKTYKFKLY